MNNHGNFAPEAPQTEWQAPDNAPDRNMVLLREFWFDDPQGKRWSAPKCFTIDGATIPRALWHLVGSPYTGDYRRASIVHDKACVDAVGNPTARRAADKMFYHACRRGGCSVRDAIILYVGVRIGAILPFIPGRKNAMETDRPRLYRTDEDQLTIAEFQVAAEDVLRGGETDDVDEIEERTTSALEKVFPYAAVHSASAGAA